MDSIGEDDPNRRSRRCYDSRIGILCEPCCRKCSHSRYNRSRHYLDEETMLVEYNVTNFRSIRNEEGISMEPYPPEVSAPEEGFSRIAAVYGHNAAGKTTLVESLQALRRLVLESSRFQNGGEMLVEPCIFDGGSDEPTSFDIRFISSASYRYIVSVFRNAVVEETLISDGNLVFRRDERILKGGLTFGEPVPEEDREKIRFAYGMTSPYTLLLSKCSESRIETTHQPFEWFRTRLCFGTSGDTAVIERALDVDRNLFLTMLRQGDTGISDVTLVDAENLLDDYFSSRQTKFPGKRVLLKHTMNGGSRGYSFRAEDESSGTVRMMYLSAHLVWVMRNGGTLVVDELERSLHPMLVDYLIGIVQDPEINPLGAQLVFTTHDTGIVRRNGLGRDQIWIASRNPSVGVTVVYPFTNFDDDSDFETLYMDSRIGGVPRIREGLRW